MFMSRAIELAKLATGEVAVGAVLVKDGEIIAEAHNQKEQNNDVTSHAEILAIRDAEQKLGNWRLDNCDLYVTLEPCPMCAWAIVNSRIKNVYFGSYDLNYGALGSKIDLRKLANSKLNVYGGIMEEECDKVLSECFEGLR
ncbi:MAG: nucleoside deaminase [Cyanobacteria bacterium SIG32]|nr:nucleoside deaminase [Cyanobacteria bacterium SIG32]